MDILYHNKIFNKGSFALSSVNLYLFSCALNSNYFLYSGLANYNPITTYDADTLYFLALFSKIIYYWSGFIICQTKVSIFTIYRKEYYLEKQKQGHNMPICFSKVYIVDVFQVDVRYHYLIHLEYIQQIFQLFLIFEVITQLQKVTLQALI